MIFLLCFALLILSYYSIGYYFAIKAFEILKEFDFEKDRELFKEVGVVKNENTLLELDQKQDFYRFLFVMLTLIFFAIIVGIIVYVVVLSYKITKNDMFVFGGSLAMTILIIIDKCLLLNELKKLKDEEYRKVVAEKNERLQGIRIFYLISSIIVIISVIAFQGIYNLEETNEVYYNISLSIIFIYLGGMGLIAKIMFLKIPLKLDGRLQPFINTGLFLAGLYLLFSSLYKIM